jgi:diguanylate cyclase (GGDEF)-like protein
MHRPDEPSCLLAELEVTRRELAVANRRIAKLIHDRKRSRMKITRLHAMATTDALTELANRRRFEEVLGANFALSVIRDSPISLIMVDVDWFKSYNDTFGHSAGDFVLRVIALNLMKSARANDVAARYGGDEFAILLHEADATVALMCAERFRDAIASFHWPLRPITASLGVATRAPSMEGPAALLEAADRALYQSKREGRSRVVHLAMVEAVDTSTSMTQEPTPSRAETYW